MHRLSLSLTDGQTQLQNASGTVFQCWQKYKKLVTSVTLNIMKQEPGLGAFMPSSQEADWRPKDCMVFTTYMLSFSILKVI